MGGEFAPRLRVDSNRMEIDKHIRVLHFDHPFTECECDLVCGVECEEVGRVTDFDQLSVEDDRRKADVSGTSLDKKQLLVGSLETDLIDIRASMCPACGRLAVTGRHDRAQTRSFQEGETRIDLIRALADQIVYSAVNAVNLI